MYSIDISSLPKCKSLRYAYSNSKMPRENYCSETFIILLLIGKHITFTFTFSCKDNEFFLNISEKISYRKKFI